LYKQFKDDAVFPQAAATV
ncbi:unnamed protein product, partial [Allacma fusca]